MGCLPSWLKPGDIVVKHKTVLVDTDPELVFLLYKLMVIYEATGEPGLQAEARSLSETDMKTLRRHAFYINAFAGAESQ